MKKLWIISAVSWLLAVSATAQNVDLSIKIICYHQKSKKCIRSFIQRK